MSTLLSFFPLIVTFAAGVFFLKMKLIISSWLIFIGAGIGFAGLCTEMVVIGTDFESLTLIQWSILAWLVHSYLIAAGTLCAAASLYKRITAASSN
jgi:hypothetical protein